MRQGILIPSIIFSVGGLILIVLSAIFNFLILGIVYGVPAVIIGLFILFNGKEDKIEGIRTMKPKNTTNVKGGMKK